MGDVPVLNLTKQQQGIGRYDLPPQEWTDVPYEIAAKVAELQDFRVDSKELIGDFRFRDDDGTYLGWCSPFHYADGYGSIAQEIAKTFIRMGVGLSIWPRDYDPSHRMFGGYGLDEWEKKAFVPREIVECLRKGKQKCFYGINFTWPKDVHRHPFARGIGYTMFETTRPPLEWAESMNLCRRVVVPCKQNKVAFQGIGVDTPIDVIPLGVDPDKWPERTAQDEKQHDDGKFIFLMAAGITTRKNPLGAARAFVAAFPTETDVRLVLKTRGYSTVEGFRDWVRQLPRDDRIQVICEETTPAGMVQYMHQADAFLFPSLGEGFGLTPLQAMCCGLPTIVSNNSGMSEYCDTRYNFPVDCHETKVPKCADGGFPEQWGDCGNWWTPNFDMLVSNMRHVYKDRDNAREVGKRAAQWVRANWTVERVCERLLDVVARDSKED